MRIRPFVRGGVAEWLKAPVLKTGRRVTVSWVRIPPPPPLYRRLSPKMAYVPLIAISVAGGGETQHVCKTLKAGEGHIVLPAITLAHETRLWPDGLHHASHIPQHDR